MPLGDRAKAALPLRAAPLKQQAMITRQSGKAASGKLVWNQHNPNPNPKTVECIGYSGVILRMDQNVPVLRLLLLFFLV